MFLSEYMSSCFLCPTLTVQPRAFYTRISVSKGPRVAYVSFIGVFLGQGSTFRPAGPQTVFHRPGGCHNDFGRVWAQSLRGVQNDTIVMQDVFNINLQQGGNSDPESTPKRKKTPPQMV